VTDVEDDVESVPTGFQLFQNYPNPFNPTTAIRFGLPVSGWVSLKIFNMLGQEIATLVNDFKSAGIHTVTFNAFGLPSGVYFYKVESAGKGAVRKLVLLK
jgi:hypothetical protein